MALRHPVHSHHIVRIPDKDLGNLFFAGVARRAGVTLLSLFSPVYLFEMLVDIGASTSTGIVAVLLYYLLVFFIKFIVLNMSEDLSRKIGYKKVAKLSGIPFFIFIFLIIYSSHYPVLFVLAAISWGIHSGLFWWGYHGYFIKSGSRDHYGESIGEARFLETLAIILSPLLGGVVAGYLGFTSLFILSAVFMLISMLFLGNKHEKKQTLDVSFNEVFRAIAKNKSVSLAYIGTGGEAIINSVLWPLFLYLFFGELISIGSVVSVASLLAAFFAIIAGKWVDDRGERGLIAVGAPLIFMSWVMKAFFWSTPSFILSDGIWNFSERMVVLPLNALTYKKAFDGGSAKAILFRETALIIGIFAVLTLVILVIFAGGSMTLVFLMAGLFSVLPFIAIVKRRI
jgi:MFS family permease